MDKEIIKVLAPIVCPDCGKTVYIELQIVPPTITKILTKDNINIAKQKVEEAINEKLTGEKQAAALEWLHKDDTAFSEDDVESIISTL